MIIFHEHRKTDAEEHVLSLRKLKISENVQIRMLLLFCLKFVISRNISLEFTSFTVFEIINSGTQIL